METLAPVDILKCVFESFQGFGYNLGSSPPPRLPLIAPPENFYARPCLLWTFTEQRQQSQKFHQTNFTSWTKSVWGAIVRLFGPSYKFCFVSFSNIFCSHVKVQSDDHAWIQISLICKTLSEFKRSHLSYETFHSSKYQALKAFTIWWKFRQIKWS